MSFDENRSYEDVVTEALYSKKDPTKLDYTIVARENGKPVGRIYITRIDRNVDSLDITRFYICLLYTSSAREKGATDMSTIDYYDQNAQEYYERTVDADLAEIREYFLGFLRRDARILDFGCGSGRDAKAFAEAGRTVEALDGSPELCRIASEYMGLDVRNMMFQDFEETEAYDGLWAFASILHLTYEEIMDVMKRIHGAVSYTHLVLVI